jgi:hypothetical protein
MQIPYGALIACSILLCVYLNNKFENRRCMFILIFLCPNIAGAFGLRFVSHEHNVGRYICYLLTGPYNAAFVLILSLQVANTAGHTKKVVTNAVLFLGYCESPPSTTFVLGRSCVGAFDARSFTKTTLGNVLSLADP